MKKPARDPASDLSRFTTTHKNSRFASRFGGRYFFDFLWVKGAVFGAFRRMAEVRHAIFAYWRTSLIYKKPPAYVKLRQDKTVRRERLQLQFEFMLAASVLAAGKKKGEDTVKTKRFAALLLAAVMLLLFAACGSKPTEDGNSAKTKRTEHGVKITQTAAAAVQTEKYETADFSITIPKGWTVSTSGINIYHSIRVYDPAEPLNQMFILLKAEPLLHCEEGKAAWQYSYDAGSKQNVIFAKAPVLKKPSTEGFFKIFPQYADFISTAEPTYSGYNFPRFENFTVTERYASTNDMKAYAMGDELLRATFRDNGKEGEGLFSASVVDFGAVQIWTGRMNGYIMESADGGYYMVYNIVAITAAKDTFIEWEDVLTSCFKTLKYSDSFVNATNRASNEKVALAKQISQNFNQTMDGFMSSWESRNISQDIMSQKQSDATLGYERVYDTETGRIYKATNGFTDDYDGKRYQPVTDDSMYAKAVSGYIEKQ